MKYKKNIINFSFLLKIIVCIIIHTSYCILPSFANDCLLYKINPIVEIKTPEWDKEVVQPLKPMDLWHGNVVATLTQNYEIRSDTTSIEDGFCVGLRLVDATIGYSDFSVQIDSRHMFGTCSYNAILSHEDEHIRAYLSVIDDYHQEIDSAIHMAANSIMPVFVTKESEIEAATDALHQNLKSHPEIILIQQKILAEQEIRNKRIDQHNHGDELRKCVQNP